MNFKYRDNNSTICRASVTLIYTIVFLLVSFFLLTGQLDAQRVVTEPPPEASMVPGIAPSPAPPGAAGGPRQPASSGEKTGPPSPTPPPVQPSPPPQPTPIASPPPQPGISAVPPAPIDTPAPPGPGEMSTGSTQVISSQGLSPIIHIFYLVLLVVMVVLLGFYHFRSYQLNLRVHRLEALVEKSALSPISQEEPLPFSWQQALKSIEGGWSLFTEENRIHAPGVVAIIAKDADLGFLAIANLIHRMIAIQNLAVVYLSKERGEDHLGKALLSIESGISVDSLSAREREELVNRYALEMTKYESGLFILQDFNISPDSLYEHVLKLAENYEIGLIIIEGREVVSSENIEELIARLRVIAIKTYVPIILVDPFPNIEPEKLSEDTLDRLTALMEIKRSEDQKGINFKVYKFQGEPPPETLKTDPDTGEIKV